MKYFIKYVQERSMSEVLNGRNEIKIFKNLFILIKNFHLQNKVPR